MKREHPNKNVDLTKFFVSRVKTNLHIMVALPPTHKLFRVATRYVHHFTITNYVPAYVCPDAIMCCLIINIYRASIVLIQMLLNGTEVNAMINNMH